MARCTPHLSASSSFDLPDGCTKLDVFRDAMSKLSSKPTVAFMFYTGSPKAWLKAMDSLPPSTAFLGASSPHIQFNSTMHVSNTSQGRDAVVARNSAIALQLGAFPDAEVAGFSLERRDDDASVVINQALAHHPTNFWQVFIVYACGNVPHLEDVLATLQTRYPQAAIIGGICSAADYRFPCLRDSKQPSVDSDLSDPLDTSEDVDVKTLKVAQLRSLVSQVFGKACSASLVERSEVTKLIFMIR